MNNQYHRFLIIRTDRIGDVLLTLPMAQVIKQQFPNAHVAMLIRKYTTELVEDNEYVDQIIYYDENGGVLSPFFQFVKTIRSQNFDVVIHTQPRPRLALATWLAAIPVRIGTGYRWYSFLFNKKM
ncbi:MAG: glycosyltransferase family 9 protein, partial [Ignavibacteriales bacterium]|nr:glycosyltransferase family 9 protein [Ignavibacteriales bacterium]